MDIVMVTAEAIPFAKTGGLADVCGTLPSRMAARGHRCSVFMPAYSRVFATCHSVQDIHVGFVVDIAGRHRAVRIMKSTIEDGPVDFYFVDQPHYFGRPHLYGDEHGDYLDNCERFAFFCRAVVQAIDRLRLPVDVVHCHDWQSGLVPAYVKTNFENHSWYSTAGVVTTIHNLAYQGRFWVHDMPLTGLGWEYFNWQQMEFYNDICFLKTGIAFSDLVTTVSPNYALEIQRPEFGCGLDGVLRDLDDRLVGIVNGVDYRIWDPLTDDFLPQAYGVENWKSGKASSKAYLQQQFGLSSDPTAPMIGLVGRFATQKGWDLVIPLMERMIVNHNVQWAILGSGETRFQEALQRLAAQHPSKVGVRIEFSDRMAHLIEAGADMFLMPSQYEPCGLNQLYSLRYGTVPIVHAVGGLVDTVSPFSPSTVENRSATGFTFHHYDVDSLEAVVHQAIDVFRREPQVWEQLVETGMRQDWSWGRSAQRYEEVFQRVLKHR